MTLCFGVSNAYSRYLYGLWNLTSAFVKAASLLRSRTMYETIQRGTLVKPFTARFSASVPFAAAKLLVRVVCCAAAVLTGVQSEEVPDRHPRIVELVRLAQRLGCGVAGEDRHGDGQQSGEQHFPTYACVWWSGSANRKIFS